MTGPVRSVSQAFAILRLLADEGALTLSDIGKMIGSSPSSCLNLLKTLVAERVIERDMRTKRYRLALPWQDVDALRDSRAARLVDRSLPLLGRFAQANDAAVGLWKIVSRDRMQLAARGESDAGMRLTLADDQRQPLGAGAAGRAITAAQAVDAAELARRFGSVRWQTELAFEAYASQVDEARTKGFAVDHGHAHRGVFTAASALTDIAPGFCITASFVAGSRSERELETIGAALSKLGKEIALLSA
ncbi:transcriptional regulator, IclR family [Sphingopyxis sp. YR583]|jgi:IclR family acetate operon transcriptional repressor|uniref:helix-turn-helix domain-containing protein n=1 Tax=Sphingopyxis sp. YR583 TaxID=1881047 RepID=UPI0008A7F346|nr:helix-turn-helix domain-containing protein [Sphingopyxis sp. YR583]SEH18848.1 transcriptional regulator, IclR family [Sphingopyxis sp. YR583]